MARIQVTVKATAGSFHMEGQTLSGETRTYEYTPDQIATIGSSMGGYLVAPLSKDGRLWGWWRISGGMRDLLAAAQKAIVVPGVTLNGAPLRRNSDTPEQLIACIKRDKPERVAVNGRQYLFATTAGSAQNGVLHPYRPTTDPVLLALQKVGCGDKRRGRVVPLDDAIGAWSGHNPSTTWDVRSDFVSDGALETVEPYTQWRRVTGITPDTTYIVWATWGRNGVSSRKEVTVAMAPNANTQQVAEAILRLASDRAAA